MNYEMIKLLTTTTVLLPVLLTLLLLYQLTKHLRSKIPPGPSSIPFLGSIGFFRSFKRRGHVILTEVADRYGPVFSIKAGKQLVVFLNDYRSIYEAFVEQCDTCSDRPNGLLSLQLGLRHGRGLVWQNLHDALPMRKFVMQTLREFGVGKRSLEDKIRVEIDAMNDVISGALHQKLTLKPILKKAVINIIHDIVFGSRYEYDDPKHDDLQGMLDEFFKGGLFVPDNFLPAWICRLLPGNKEAYAKKQAAVEQLGEYVFRYIDEHELTCDDVTTRDYIDLYIHTCRRGAPEERQYLTRGNIFRTILDVFIAGSDTTATTLENCFRLVTQYPHVQESCFREIVEASGDAEYVDVDMVKKCPYVEAVLMEVQRLTSVAPVGLPHVTSGPVEVKGYIIPSGSMVFANLFKCGMDPDIWENPKEFRPERHLDSNNRVVRNKKLIPFSVGPRACLGEIMARMELRLICTNLLRRFKFTGGDRSDDDVNRPVEYHPLGRISAFEVMVTERTAKNDVTATER